MPDQRVASSPEASSSPDAPTRRAATISRIRELPANPAPLIGVLNCPGDDPEAVATALQGCPILSGRVLGVTNSAAYGLMRPIETVRRATLQLGAARTRAIALAFGLRMISEGTDLPAELRDLIWINSLRKAAAARLAAELIQPRAAERAYCLSLVQDLALPLLVSLDEALYRATIVPGDDTRSWSAIEREHFGLDHAELGAHLLREWNAGEPIIHAVQRHHEPPGDASDTDALACMPLFLASLLPHLDEESSAYQRQWLAALHGQFLAETYASPDAFLHAAADAAAPLHGGKGSVPEDGRFLVGQLIEAVTDETFSLVTQLSRLEHTLHQQREDIDELRFQAFTDPLTSVLNRRGFTHLARHRLDAAHEAQCGVCCIMLDLDDLKPLNDVHGHNAGDIVLRELASLLLNNVDRSDIIGRIGGDEFAILLSGVERDQAQQIVQRVFEACCGKSVRVSEDHEHMIRMSLGAIYVAAECAVWDIDAIMNAADATMYDQKRAGKGGIMFRDCTCAGADRCNIVPPEQTSA